MKQQVLIAFLALTLAACQANPLVRVAQQGLPERPPKIDRVVDLGSHNVTAAGELDQAESDGLFIAGEWAAIVGRGLNTERSRLFLDGTELPLHGGIEGGGLLFRLPPDVLYRHTYALRVETPLGVAETSLPVTNVIVMADPRSDQVLFWRSSLEEKPAFEEDATAVICPGAGPYAFAPSGGVLYATARGNKPKHEGLSWYEFKAVHLGAKNGPQEISSLAFKAKHLPVSLAVSGDGAFGFLVTSGELLVFDLSPAEGPKFVARQNLPAPAKEIEPGYRDLVLLGNGSQGAILDETGGQVLLIDFSRPTAPSVVAAFPVVPGAKSQPVGLAADRSDANMLWILTGINAHQVGLHLSNLWAEKPADAANTRASLVRMEWQENVLIPHEPLALPDGALPLGLFSEKNGDVLVSAVAYDKETFAKTELSVKGATSLLKGVRNSLFAGRIYRVSAQGKVTTVVTSINLLLAMSRLDDSPLVFSTYRFSMNYLFPSVKLVLGVDVLKRQSLLVREMDWKTILPPYRFFPEITLL
ncbi:MAG: hypothetical protein A2005_12600 [Desulfuromonadales bacterium GWC2_61_20]|nr:MAG: hypothetical protein A2005_12600 [Desulfuromonadales bacterium GWC2_61_20]HAD03348.1 hypothetical protein [Desulfuromonas sp.]